jgi:hypothetical protein
MRAASALAARTVAAAMFSSSHTASAVAAAMALLALASARLRDGDVDNLDDCDDRATRVRRRHRALSCAAGESSTYGPAAGTLIGDPASEYIATPRSSHDPATGALIGDPASAYIAMPRPSFHSSNVPPSAPFAMPRS